MHNVSRIVLIRHGQSTYNEKNLFTGWKDVELTQKGIGQAHAAANLIQDIDFTHAFTSKLKRARNTLDIILKDLNVDSTSFIDRVGIWVTKVKGKPLFKEKKIGAIGLRIKKWVTYHGISFNLNPDLTYYNNIQACGLCDYTATSLQELGIDFSQEDFDRLFIDFFK